MNTEFQNINPYHAYMKKFVLYLLLLMSFSIFSQNSNQYREDDLKRIDSLKTLLENKNLTTRERVQFLEDLTYTYFLNNETQLADKYINKIEQIAIEEKDTISLAISYKGKAFISYRKGEDKDKIPNLKKAISLFSNYKGNFPNKNQQLYSCYTFLSELHIEVNNYGDASKAVLKAKEFISNKDDINSNYAKIDVLNIQGYINSEIENNAEALKNLKDALVLETKINDDFGKANTYNAIGIIYSKQKNETKALEYYQLALDIHLKLKNKDAIGTCYNNIAISYYELGEYKKARNLLFKSIEIALDINHKTLLADSYLYMGKSYIAENKIDLGLLNITKSINYSHEIKSPTLIVENLLVKVDVANKHNNTAKAIALLNEALPYINKTETIDLKKRVYESLTKTYAKTNVEKSNFYNQKYKEVKDSIEFTQQKHKTDVLKAEFDNLKIKADLKNRDHALLLAKERENAAKTKFRLLTAMASLFIIALVIITLRQVKLNKTRKKMWLAQKEVLALKQEKLDNEISFKNQQITDFAIHISEKNELLEKIKQKIKNVNIPNQTSSRQISDLILFINDDINQNKEKAQLYSEIDETTESFNHKIDSLYNNLTEKERKIATLVRLNHTSKQIALQLNITPASVDNYRSNLRKKMNIPKEISLAKFIKNI
ncbi:tetratricopeptide repeat protein [Pseudofulvibacter geojedonensis]|uniref:Tetratricopeptide repeat protein n=1 Tax=Pseudofulvibacter geojedonensis TaxID=1123758 RepID=A0ABW3HYR0_9FLAO